MSKKCTRCITVKPLSDYYSDKRASDGKASQCKACNCDNAKAWARKNRDKLNGFKRAWRKANPDKVRLETKAQRAKNPIAYKARNAVMNALKAGKISKMPCVYCLAEKVEAHHYDYSKPLEVMWLCAEHHGMIHRLKRNNKEK